MANASSKGVIVHLGDLFGQRYLSDSFEAVVMNHVIEHVPDLSLLLKECFRILKPGGIFVSYTPNSRSFLHRFYKSSWYGLDPPRHFHFFNVMNLKNIAEGTGFPKVAVSTTIRNFGGVFWGSHSILRKGRHDKEMPPSLIVRLFAIIFSYLEWVVLKIKPDVGGEIFLLAEKVPQIEKPI